MSVKHLGIREHFSDSYYGSKTKPVNFGKLGGKKTCLLLIIMGLLVTFQTI